MSFLDLIHKECGHYWSDHDGYSCTRRCNCNTPNPNFVDAEDDIPITED